MALCIGMAQVKNTLQGTGTALKPILKDMQETCKRVTGISILEYHGSGLLTLHMPSFQPASLLTNPYDLIGSKLTCVELVHSSSRNA